MVLLNTARYYLSPDAETNLGIVYECQTSLDALDRISFSPYQESVLTVDIFSMFSLRVAD